MTCKAVMNDENAVNVARTRGNFVDPRYHKKQISTRDKCTCVRQALAKNFVLLKICLAAR